MMQRRNILATLLACSSFVLLGAGMISSAQAEQQNPAEGQQVSPNRIYGKVVEAFDVNSYTYAQVDTGSKKVWVAGPVTPLKVGDMIAFSTEMLMEKFKSKTVGREFSKIYFTSHFISDKETPANKAAATASPHAQLKQQQAASSPHAQFKKKKVAKPVTGIEKVEGGKTIAEIYTQKQDLKGKTIRVRGQVTRYTAKVMGKNWLHVKDSSTQKDLTVTTNSTAAIDDVVVLEGTLGLDKDYNYGYVYPVLLEDATIAKE